MNRQEKLDYIKEYIEDNPEYSATQVYNDIKGTKYGIRKQDTFNMYRSVTHKPKREQPEKYIPKKYLSLIHI